MRAWAGIVRVSLWETLDGYERNTLLRGLLRAVIVARAGGCGCSPMTPSGVMRSGAVTWATLGQWACAFVGPFAQELVARLADAHGSVTVQGSCRSCERVV